MVRTKKDNLEVLSRKHLVKLRNEINDLRDLTMVFTGIETASRVGELEYLKVSGFDPDAKTIMKYDIKKKEWRKVGLSDWLCQQLVIYITTTKVKDCLWPGRGKKPHISVKSADEVLKKWCAYIGIKEWVSWHILRHTYVSQAAEVGIGPDIVMYVTGDRWATLKKYYRKPIPMDMGSKNARFYEEAAPATSR